MPALFSKKADKELGGMDAALRKLFILHVEKMLAMPPRRHMRFGMPFYVENVTAQARMAYNIEGETIYILRCFATHKEYERWYKSFK